MKANVKDVALISAYIVLGVLTRTVWHIAPNVEFVTALAIAGAYFLRKRSSYLIPLGIMIVTDFIIGNQAIFIFTWSAFGIAHVIGKIAASKRVEKLFEKLPQFIALFAKSEFFGIAFTLLFFLWTNLGVVLTTNMYPKTVEGVFLSYEMGLPFLVPQLIGNMIIVPAVFFVTELVYNQKLNLANSEQLTVQ